MTRQYHTQLDDGESAPYVLLPGDPGRVEAIASTWDTCEKMAQNREYVSYRGMYKGMPISCTSTGIGGASTAIAMEELARVGAKVFLRVGTCGVLQKKVRRGDLIIFDSAARFDGTTQTYAPLEFPAVTHHTVLQANIQAAEDLGIPYHVGCTRSHDGYFTRRPTPGASFNNYWQSSWGGTRSRSGAHGYPCFGNGSLCGVDIAAFVGAARGRYGNRTHKLVISRK